jgi:ribosomal protein L29
MKNSEIRSLSSEELAAKLTDAQISLQSMKFAHAISPIENPSQITKLRKFVARLKTESHARVNADLSQKIAAGDLTVDSARDYLQVNHSDAINLSKIKKLVGKNSK